MASGHCLLATTTTKNGVPSALAPALWTCATGATANHVSANTRQPQTTLAPAMGREGDVIVGPIFASWPCTATLGETVIPERCQCGGNAALTRFES